MEEIWRNIKDYEEYQVSNLGNVRSLNYGRTGKVQILKPGKNKNGYLQVVLWKDGKMKCCRVHRLVAAAFLPNPDNLPQINHRDEDKTNNRVENLEFCSREYNINYGTRNQRVAETLKGVPLSEETKKKLSISLAQYTKEGNLIAVFFGVREAERQTGIDSSGISKCCRGKYKTYRGFIWKYV